MTSTQPLDPFKTVRELLFENGFTPNGSGNLNVFTKGPLFASLYFAGPCLIGVTLIENEMYRTASYPFDENGPNVDPEDFTLFLTRPFWFYNHSFEGIRVQGKLLRHERPGPLALELDADFGALVGRTVSKVEVSEGESVLVFTTDKGQFVYETDGGCCSETWFADLIGYSNLIGHKVLDHEVLDVDYNPPDEAERGRQECDKAYGHKLVTTKGYVDIVFRNSSNGYYSGEMMRMSGVPHHIDKLVEITDDWQA